MSKLDRKDLPQSVRKTISSFQIQSTTFNSKTTAHIEKEFDKWVKEIKGKIYPLKSRHSHPVFRNYFYGTPPFSGRRTKDHIPDAFIFEEIKNIVKEHHPLNVVVEDNRLRSACETIKDVIVFSSLDEFIKSDQCQVLLKDHVFERQLPTIKAQLSQHETYLEYELSKKLIDALAWKVQVKDHDIPSDDQTAYISMVDEPKELEIDYAHLEYLGGGTLLLAFKCEIEVTLDYYIFKADYYVLSDNRSAGIYVNEYDNRHYYEAEESRTVQVEGVFSSTLDLSNLGDEEDITESLEALVQDAVLEIEKINSVRLGEAAGREPF